MLDILISRIKTTKLGKPQSYRNIVVYPLTDSSGNSLTYITLGEALEGHTLTIAELTQGGSVPELKVTNTAEVPVLLLDGEELAGAKQNRVLNTSVLVPEKQSIVIPVSCTEQGRWAYDTPTFYDSGTVMSRSIRARKNQSVSESLHASASFRSNQGEVWDGIAELQAAAGVPSPTAAMRDVFSSQSAPIEQAMKAFPLVDGQQGMLAIINGEAAGFDLISLPSAYSRLHGKLIKSYVMDALLGKAAGATASGEALTQKANAFLQQATICEEKVFKSVGYGNDHRFKDGSIAGSALVHADTAVHLAFFRLEPGASDGHMSGLNRRRSYRTH